jgi:hypothetical protein
MCQIVQVKDGWLKSKFKMAKEVSVANCLSKRWIEVKRDGGLLLSREMAK